MMPQPNQNTSPNSPEPTPEELAEGIRLLEAMAAHYAVVIPRRHPPFSLFDDDYSFAAVSGFGAGVAFGFLLSVILFALLFATL